MAKVFHDANSGKQILDLDTIWRRQAVPEALRRALLVAAAEANNMITHPPSGVRNMSEWAKQQACWNGLKGRRLDYPCPPAVTSVTARNPERQAGPADLAAAKG